MPKRDKPPPCIIKKTPRGLLPAIGYDAERLMAFPLGTEFDLIPRTKRSNKQLRLYWSMVTHVQRATGCSATPRHLSDEIKLTLGYRTLLADLRTGNITESVDSIALEEMKHEDFLQYFEAAQALLAEKFGFDPMAYLEAA